MSTQPKPVHRPWNCLLERSIPIQVPAFSSQPSYTFSCPTLVTPSGVARARLPRLGHHSRGRDPCVFAATAALQWHRPASGNAPRVKRAEKGADGRHAALRSDRASIRFALQIKRTTDTGCRRRQGRLTSGVTLTPQGCLCTTCVGHTGPSGAALGHWAEPSHSRAKPRRAKEQGAEPSRAEPGRTELPAAAARCCPLAVLLRAVRMPGWQLLSLSCHQSLTKTKQKTTQQHITKNKG